MAVKTLNRKTAAEMVGVHPNTLDNWNRHGYGPKRVKIGGRIAYVEDEVARFVEEQFAGAEKAPTVLADDEGRKQQDLGGSAAASEHIEGELWVEKWLAMAPPLTREQQAQIVRILRGGK